MQRVYGIVLAGGEGNRLKPLTSKTAKPVVTYAGNTNTLSLALGSLFGCDIDLVDVYTQYASDSINDFINDCWRPVLDSNRGQALRVVRARKGRTYQGTADAVFHNIDAIKQKNPSHVIITAADHACWIDYKHFVNFHQSKGADLSIAVIPVPKKDAEGKLGVLKVDDRHRVMDFQEKPGSAPSMPGYPDKTLASMGIYVFKTAFLIDILSRAESQYEGRHDFGKHIIPMALAENAKVYAHYFDGYWKDLGSIETYYNAQINDLIGPRPLFDPYANPFMPDLGIKQPLLAPVNIHDAAIANGVLIGNGCRIKRCLMERAILSPEVTIETGVNLRGAIIHHGATIGSNSILEKVVIGPGVSILPNTVITPDKINFQGEYFGGKFGITVVV